MPKSAQREAPDPSVQKGDPSLHIDDFLNGVERRAEAGRETLAAFARRELRSGRVKDTEAAFMRRLRDFMSEVPGEGR